MSWRLESRAPGTEDRRASVQGTRVWGRRERNAAGMDHGGGNEMEEVACFSLPSRKKKKDTLKKMGLGDFPSGPVAKTPRSQCGGSRFDPWSGN